MKQLSPLFRENHKEYSPEASRLLFDGRKVSPILDFDFDDTLSQESINALYKISVSGAQEKFPAIIENGHIKLATTEMRSTHILKPAPWSGNLNRRHEIPCNEHLTMRIASQIYGIKTAANGLCFTPSGKPVYITKRFDILPDGEKVPMEDFASLIGKSEQIEGRGFKYTGSYTDVARCIRSCLSAWMVDMERFFELLVFNYIHANGDAHLKNFSLLRIGEDYRLSPAYDLLNTALHLSDDNFALSGGLGNNFECSEAMSRTGNPTKEDFGKFGLEIGLVKKRIDRILSKYTELPPETKTLIENCFLSKKLQRSYLRVISERLSRFNRS